jgi:predicted ATPase
LSHLTLFEDPIPTPLLGIEEPASYMGHSQIMAFVDLIQHHVRELGGTQFFATTNSNTLIDLVDPTEVWFLRRDEGGSIQASRGLDDLQFLDVDINSVGPYWYSQYIYSTQESSPLTSSIVEKSSISTGTQ